ncbi:MAG: RdgB/HAM1 family non-canonical purine NTP pyrophosphatase [Solirubrobacteraceae bacterium]|nr:RdgB/HAM1 family non-canonical purine NTP pyrophosphatase [Solirubrobacteraceae bacterium]
MPELVLSTRNEHKVREFNGLLPGWQVLPLPDEVELPPETGDTFAANALVKARAAAEATGMAAIADDSGIEAPALGGAPGVYSARYAGEDASDEANLDKLMAEVAKTDDATVEYVCAVAYVEPGGCERVFEGRCRGMLIEEKRGDGGFGYDPAVVPDDYDDGRTMAELTQEEKDKISHRGRAARDLLTWLDSLSA